MSRRGEVAGTVLAVGSTALADDLASARAGADLFSLLRERYGEGSLVGLERRSAVAGTVVVREGDAADACFIVESGDAEVWQATSPAFTPPAPGEPWEPDGRRWRRIAALQAGDRFGEVGLLAGGRRTATVRAATDMRLASLDSVAFHRILDENRGLSLALEEELVLLLAADALRRSPVFKALSNDDIRLLAPHVEHVSYREGDVLFHRGDAGQALYVLQAGHVDLLAHDPPGSHSVARLGAREVLGEHALVTGAARTLTARAADDVDALRIPFDAIRAMARERRIIAQGLLHIWIYRQRPQRIPNCSLTAPEGSSGDEVILKAPDGRGYLKMSQQAAYLWSLMDREHTVKDLALANYKHDNVLDLESVVRLVMQLHGAGFLDIQGPTAEFALTAPLTPLRALLRRLHSSTTHYWSLPDCDRVVTRLYRVVRPAYRSPAWVLAALAGLAGVAVYLRTLFGDTPSGPDALHARWWFAPALAGMLVLHFVCHEFLGHATMTKHFRREVHRAGVGLYLLLPVAFVDTSDMWLASKRQRVAVSIAGPLVNFLLASTASLCLLGAHDAVLRALLIQFASVGYVLTLVNLNPLLEMDGYYVLMDWLDIPNLRRKALGFVGARLWRSPLTITDRRLRRIYTGYGALALLYTVVLVYTISTSYHRYLDHLMRRLAPSASAAIGWAIPVVLCAAVIAVIWTELTADLVRKD